VVRYENPISKLFFFRTVSKEMFNDVKIVCVAILAFHSIAVGFYFPAFRPSRPLRRGYAHIESGIVRRVKSHDANDDKNDFGGFNDGDDDDDEEYGQALAAKPGSGNNVWDEEAIGSSIQEEVSDEFYQLNPSLVIELEKILDDAVTVMVGA